MLSLAIKVIFFLLKYLVHAGFRKIAPEKIFSISWGIGDSRVITIVSTLSLLGGLRRLFVVASYRNSEMKNATKYSEEFRSTLFFATKDDSV